MSIRNVAVAACMVLGCATASAQTLEQTYSELCADPAAARSEACTVMAQALAAKPQGRQPREAPASAGEAGEPQREARWGLFAEVVDVPLVDFLVDSAGEHLFEPAVIKYTWTVPWEVMAVSVRQPDGSFEEVSTLRWDSGRRGLVDSSMPADAPGGLLAWQPDGSYVMDVGGARVIYRRLPDRTIELRAEVDQGQGLQMLWVQHRVEATPANVKAVEDTYALMKQIAANSAATNALMAEITRRDQVLKSSPLWQQTLVNRANAEAERARKRASGSNGLQIFGAILQGLSQGLVESAGYANGGYDAYGPVGSFDRAQADMAATVEGIQRQAAAERVQQQRLQSPAGAQASQPASVAVPAQTHGAAAEAETAAAPTRYRALEGPGTGSWASAGTASSRNEASTRDDPSTCVSPPVTSTHRCDTLSGHKALVSNQCAAPVDIRVCFMTDSGWNCQSNYDVAPGGDWEPGWCHASTGQVFHASRYSDSDVRLESP